jgi:hypothetical protein
MDVDDITPIAVPGFLADNKSDSKLNALTVCTGLLLMNLVRKGVMTPTEVDDMFDTAIAIALGSSGETSEPSLDRLLGAIQQGRTLFDALNQPGVIP